MSDVPRLTCIERPLDGRGGLLACAIGHEFPVVAGIADRRPPLRRYCAPRPEVSAPLVERFVAGDVIGADRAAEVADQAQAPVGPASVVARAENVLLVAAADVIEHVPDAVAFARACDRVTRQGGAVWLSTPNRVSLPPEPHVRVGGVGYLPRRAGRRLAQRVRGVPYDDVRTPSLRGLRRRLAPTGGRLLVDTPRIAQTVRAGYRPVARPLIDGYHLARRVPIVGRVLLGLTPLFQAVLVKPPAADGA